MDELTDEKVLELDKKTKVIPLTSDTIGKNIFKKNIELTKVFLKDILRLKEEINSIQFIDTKLEVENVNNYKFITDLVLLVNDKIRKEFIWSVYKMSNDSKMIIDFGAEEYNNYVIEKIKRDVQIAKTVGMEEGMQRGIKKGMQKGIEQT